MTGRRGLGAIAALGALTVVLARLVSPAAPALYDGIFVQPPPYRWVSPPPDLASTNKAPTGGEGDIPVADGASKPATVKTDDGQALVFFAQGNLLAAGATAIHVAITPMSTPPPPPQGTKYIGNVYLLNGAAVGAASPLPTPVRVKAPGNVLFRVPPVKFSTLQVQLFYDNAWHKTAWSAQTDYVSANLDQFGVVASVDGGTGPPTDHTPAKSFSPVGIIELALTVLAIGVIVAAVIVQRRRGAASE